MTTHSYFLSLPNFWISYQQRIWVNQNLFTSCRFDIFCFHFAPRHFSLDFRNGKHVWTKAGGSGAPSCGQKTTSQDWAFFSSFSRCSTGQSPCCKTNWYVNSEFFKYLFLFRYWIALIDVINFIIFIAYYFILSLKKIFIFDPYFVVRVIFGLYFKFLFVLLL